MSLKDIPTAASQMFEQDVSVILQNWTVDDGLPVNSVQHVVQCNRGFLWLTTYDGLIRFDGKVFEVFNTVNQPEIPTNRFAASFVFDDQIFFTTETDHILVYDYESFTSYRVSPPEISHNIVDIIKYKPDVFLIVYGGGLGVISNNSYRKIELPLENHPHRFSSMTVDHHSGIWAATRDGVIYMPSPDDEPVWLPVPVSDSNHHIDALLPDNTSPDPAVFYGSSYGMLRIKSSGAVDTLYPGTLVEDSRIRMIERISDEAILVSTTNGVLIDERGRITEHPVFFDFSIDHDKSYTKKLRLNEEDVFLYNPSGYSGLLTAGGFDTEPYSGELKNMQINSAVKDHEGNLWLATNRNGIIKMRDREVRVFSTNQGLKDEIVTTVKEDSEGNLWVGMLYGSLDIIRPDGTVHHYKRPSGHDREFVTSIAEGPDGEMYVGFFLKGFDVIRDFEFSGRFQIEGSDNRNTIRHILPGDDNTLWLGTDGGIVKITETDTLTYSIENGLPNSEIRYLTFDQDDNLWFGTQGGGAGWFDGKSFHVIDRDAGLSSNRIRFIYPDPMHDQVMWIGTEDNGLNRVSPDGITQYTKANGIFDNVIHSILEDSKNRFWMSTNRGIFYVYRESLENYAEGHTSFVESISFTTSEGLINAEANGANQPAGYISRTGHLLFPTQNGVAIIDPAIHKLNTLPPQVRITRIFSEGKELIPSSPYVLPAGTTSFEVHYTGLSFTAPEKVRFRYKLEGVDAATQEAGTRRIAYYTNIGPGKYTFHAQASNNHGVWNEAGSTVQVYITPYFWQTSTFRFSVFIAFILLGFLLFNLRTRHLHQRKILLEETVKERTKELEKEKEEVLRQKAIIEAQADELTKINQTKDRFFSIIGHDLRGAFQGILGYSKMILDYSDEMSEEELNQSIQVLHDTSQNVFKLLQNLLNWARIQTGNIHPEIEKFNLNGVFEPAVKIYRIQGNTKGIKIKNNVPEDIFVKADTSMLDTIVRNLLSNALKFSNIGDTVTIHAQKTGNTVRLIFSDEGIGIPQAIVKKLFDLDSRVSRTGTADEQGTGLGLMLCKELSEKMNGSISVSSEVGKGSEFTVQLPAAS